MGFVAGRGHKKMRRDYVEKEKEGKPEKTEDRQYY